MPDQRITTMLQKEIHSDTNRLKSAVVDRDRNLIVTIIKYNWLECLVHSFYSLLLLALLVGVVFSIVAKWWVVAAVLFVIGIIIWMQMCIDANDKL